MAQREERGTKRIEMKEDKTETLLQSKRTDMIYTI